MSELHRTPAGLPELSAPEALAQALRQELPGLNLAPLQDAAWARRLLTLMPQRQLQAGQTLFAQGQAARAFYLLAQGQLETTQIGEQGEAALLGQLRAPVFFGLAAFVTGRPTAYEAQARSACRVWVVTAPAYALLMDEWPGFGRALLQRFAQHFDANLRQLQSARFEPAAPRLEQAVRQLLALHQPPVDAQGWQRLRVTQLELARVCHLSRQTVNELLQQAQQRGQARLGRGWLCWRG
ncbi:Crp/Fnr family transcriptional regulator [Roseateles sp. BYS180W]|uniref:Crp/Fnr family transcriptional regulator n=1 Tax=Roseateles rivi TaxID=3299028 RepID=A0ABW7FUG3_9BURK